MQTIILLHGALGASSDLGALSELLMQKGFRVYSFSFSGHGKTAFEPDFGIEQFSRELQAFIKTHQLTKPAVFGYSMGGYVALNTLLTHDGLLDKIITLGTKFNWSEAEVKKETKLLDPNTILAKVPAFAKLLEEKHGSSWKDLLKATATMMRKIGEQPALTAESLLQIKTPVLIGLADKDQMVSLEETATAFKALSNAAMYMLPDSKHQMEAVNHHLLAELIMDFINKTPA